MSRRDTKQRIFDILRTVHPSNLERALEDIPPKAAIGPLFSALCSLDEQIRWHGIEALGLVVRRLADDDLEAGRVVIRKLLWNLTEESGGIAWGAPEAIGEILSRHPALAEEYARLLIAFIRPDGTFLEYEPLQRGVIWGIARLAQVNREILRHFDVEIYLLPFLDSPDICVKGLAVWAAGLVRAESARKRLLELRADENTITIYNNHQLTQYKIADIAADALGSMAD